MSPSRRPGNGVRGERARDAKPRTAPRRGGAMGDIAPYRNGTRAVRTGGTHGRWARARQRTAPRRGGAMGTSRPTAKPHEGGRMAKSREGGGSEEGRAGYGSMDVPASRAR